MSTQLDLLIVFCVSCISISSAARIVDLTHVIKEGSPKWPNQRAYNMNVTFNGTTSLGYWYQSESICGGTHFSTHLDAPCHFGRGHWCVADIPVERLVDRPGVCIHLQDKVGNNGDYQVDTRDIQLWEEDNGKIPKGAVVLIHTGWYRFWNNTNRYRGTEDPSPTQHRFPGISPNAAQWLADNRHVYGIGIDTMSVDYGQTRLYETHSLLARRNIYVLENLDNLESLPPSGFSVHSMVIKLDKASGGPARVVAVVNNGPRIANAGVTFVSVVLGLLLVLFVGKRVLRMS